ncbi:MAG TPA: hypothetical protein VF178_05440 [Gemmatimonadaceae bacterium]
MGDAIEAALAEARAEGLIWTPLLDAIAVSVRAEARNALRHAMRLGKWIQEQTDANRLLPLLRFRCGDICWLLGLNARVFSPALLDGLIEHPVALKKAATNPALDAANATYLLGLARRAVGRSDSRSKTLIETAEILLQRLFHWTINDRRALARRLGGLPGERRDAATLLTLDTETSTRLLERVRTAEGIGFDALSNIAAHPNAPIGMLRQLAKQWHLRPVLIERPEARADAEIRAQLLHTTAGEHLRLLARETRGAEFLGIWRRLVRLQPGTAIEMLEAGEVPDDVTLGPEELAPLFHAKDREVRLRAMLAVSEAGSPAERPAMPCCDSDRRTRTPSA